MRRILFVVALTLVAGPASAGPCAIPSIEARPVFGNGAVIAPGGGVIVALGAGGFGPRNDDKAVKTEWRFVDVSKRIVPVVDDIAPGLAVYRIPATGGAELVLDDGDAKGPNELVRIRRALGAVPTLPAPKLGRVVRQDGTSGMGPRSYSFTNTSTELDAAIPKDAAMIVVYRVDASGARTPLTWSTVQEGEKSVMVYQSGGRCQRAIPGLSPANAGDRIAVAWLDRSGRLSPLSNVVTATKP